MASIFFSVSFGTFRNCILLLWSDFEAVFLRVLLLSVEMLFYPLSLVLMVMLGRIWSQCFSVAYFPKVFPRDLVQIVFSTSQDSLFYSCSVNKQNLLSEISYYSFPSPLLPGSSAFSSLLFLLCSILVFLSGVSLQWEALSWEQESASHVAVGGLSLPAWILLFEWGRVSYLLVLL